MFVIYFSQSGRTKAAAEEIRKLVGGTLARIVPTRPYPEDYDQLVDIAKDELRRQARPKFEPLSVDLTQAKSIFIGYPTWWYQQPTIINTFFEQVDLIGKTIIPFTTSGSTPIEEGLPIMQKLIQSVGATYVKGFTANSKREIKKFLERNHYLQK